MSDFEKEKKLAAIEAAQYIKDGMIIGIGSGTTMAYFVDELAKKVSAGMKIIGVPTSKTIAAQAEKAGIPLITAMVPLRVDITVDGADQFDPKLRLVKGGGGDLLHEKIVASVSMYEIIITDSRKQVNVLGGSFPLPVEVVPFAWNKVASELSKLGGRPVLRRDANSGNAFLTDENNYIIDCSFDSIPDPEGLALKLNPIPGLVEHGLFLSYASEVIMGTGDTVKHFKKENMQ